MRAEVLLVLSLVCGISATPVFPFSRGQHHYRPRGRQLNQPSLQPQPQIQDTIQDGQRVIITPTGTWRVSELPQPKPGFYLNKAFQEVEVEEVEEVEEPRVIVTSSGTWKVKELPKPKSAYYLNKQFQPGYVRKTHKPVRKQVIDKDGRVWKVSGFSDLLENLPTETQKAPETKLFPAETGNSEKGDHVRMVLVKRPLGAVKVDTADLPSVFPSPSSHSSGQTSSVRDPVAAYSYSQSGTQTDRGSSSDRKGVSGGFEIVSTSTGPRLQLVGFGEEKTPSSPSSPQSSPKSSPPSPFSNFGAKISTEDSRQPSDSNSNTGRKTFRVNAHQRQREEPPKELKDIGGSDGAFSCYGRAYGYYGDVQSDCVSYHVCNPVDIGGGNVQYYKYSFECTGGLRWDTNSNVCSANPGPCQ